MKIIIVGGFLGAGKTSFIKQAIASYTESGQKVAVIENEISPSGVDASYLEQEGVLVKELAAGCICCRLKSDLNSALKHIAKDYAPDVVFIEPTGAAVPEQVKEGLPEDITGEPVTIMLIDLARFNSLGIRRYPFLKQSIKVADAVLLNKCDKVETVIIEKTRQVVTDLNIKATCIPVSLHVENKLDGLLKQLKGQTTDKKSTHYSTTEFPHPVAVAYEMSLHEPDIMLIKSRMRQLLEKLKQAGCSLIGHIKATIQDKLGGKVFLSTTNFDSPIEIKTLNMLPSNNVNVKVNIIVYGIKESVLEALVSKVF